MNHERLPLMLALMTVGVGASAYTYAPAPSASVAPAGTAVAVAGSVAPQPDHFRMLEPTGWIEESDRGDPQKAAPCGGTNTDFGKQTYVVNEAKGGSTIHLKLEEKVYHPGHYRVALSVNSMNELPVDPRAVTRQDTVKATGQIRTMSVSAPIQNPAVAPVLADGLFVHTTQPTAPWEADILLPNINCSHCTFQVTQFMAEHADNNPGGFTYHHCAILHITADPSKPIDTRWPAERTGE